jgi:cytochrome d ubiquinol oxidase subunit II
MTTSMWGISLLWALVFFYAILGSIDFGAGFWAMVFHKQKDAKSGMLANRIISPLWEVTNVFLVLFAVALVGLFPGAAYTLGSVLLVPGSLILILLTIRTVFMVYAHVVPSKQTTLRMISGATGILIPALLITVFPLSHGYLLTKVGDHYVLPLGALFTSVSVYSFIVFGLVSELFISALFLGDYARVAEDHTAFATYRRVALFLGPLTLIFAMLILALIPPETNWIRNGLMNHWAWFVGSGLLFILGYSLVAMASSMKQVRYRFGLIAVILQYLLGLIGYGRAHMPYIVYPMVTVSNSFTNVATFRTAVLVLVVGIAILFPGFVWFWRLFLENKTYAADQDTY